MVNVETKVTAISVAVRVLISLTHIGNLFIIFPGDSVVVTVSNPKFEVIPRVRSKNSIGVF